jgi:hypothetical protein
MSGACTSWVPCRDQNNYKNRPGLAITTATACDGQLCRGLCRQTSPLHPMSLLWCGHQHTRPSQTWGGGDMLTLSQSQLLGVELHMLANGVYATVEKCYLTAFIRKQLPAAGATHSSMCQSGLSLRRKYAAAVPPTPPPTMATRVVTAAVISSDHTQQYHKAFFGM